MTVTPLAVTLSTGPAMTAIVGPTSERRWRLVVTVGVGHY
jgi:hypothetical protein